MRPRDFAKEWGLFLLNHGGHAGFLGLPAVIATVAFSLRIRWLKRHRVPHEYGRTGLIYWPGQFFISVSCFFLLALAYTLASGPYLAEADDLLMSSFFMLLAWIRALSLNKYEHRYEVRSSDYLCVYYLVSLIGSALSFFILFSAAEDKSRGFQRSFDPAPPSYYKMDPLRHLLGFSGSIALAFLVEIWPRTNTRVQRESREKERLTAYDQANLFSRLSFHYAQRIMSIGAKRPLTADDVNEKTPYDLRTQVNYLIVENFWNKRVSKFFRRHPPESHLQQHGSRSCCGLLRRERSTEEQAKYAAKRATGPSLVLTILDAYKWRIIPTMFIRMLSFALLFVAPFLFSYLLRFFSDYAEAQKEGKAPPPMAQGLLLAVGIFLSTAAQGLLLSMSSNELSNICIGARAALISMIYRKSMRLSPSARQKSTLGEITNHMAVDAESWMAAQNMLPLVLTIPLELTLCSILLYRLFGWSLFAGVAVFFIITPIQTRMGKKMHTSQREKLKLMDGRLRLLTEILSNIKIIKLYAWDDAFKDKVDGLRAKELKAQKALSTIRSILMIVFSSISLLIILATFITYVHFGGPNFTPAKMTSEVIFVGITLFAMLSRPLGLVPVAFSHIIMLTNANRRIQRFLLLEEIDVTVVQRRNRDDNTREDSSAVVIENGTFSWKPRPNSGPIEAGVSGPQGRPLSEAEAERQPLLSQGRSSAQIPSPIASPGRPTLSNISLRTRDGQLTALVGRVGQGKSSILSAILGEMYKLDGTITTYGEIAYVPQQAWIINASVRDNILLRKPFDQELYDQVVYASGLTPDLGILPAGDQTEIGERGINLSGGQKQRVSLARAAYQDADVYLMDDPLSAVDPHVDQHLWQHLIGPQGLLRNKSRILVTHGIHHLEDVDQIVVVKDGTITETGHYNDLMQSQQAFYQIMVEFSASNKNTGRQDNDQNQDQGQGIIDNSKAIGGSQATISQTVVNTVKSTNGSSNGKMSNSGALVGAEKVESGKVGWNIYLAYIKAMGTRSAIFAILLSFGAQGCQILTNFWLRFWIKEDEKGSQHSATFYLSIYSALVLVYLFVDVLASYTINVVCCVNAARTMFSRLLTRVLHMPMSFFDTTPMGRIINRFSTDVSAVDSQLSEQLPGLLSFSSQVIGIIFVISYSTPIFLVAVPPLLIIFLLVLNYYVKASGSLKRLYSVSKSPLHQHFSETLAGVSTIRSVQRLEDQFLQENETRSDLFATRANLFLLTNRWLTIRLQALCALLILLTASLAVLNADRLDHSLVGLALSYALNMTNVLGILVRCTGEVQNHFVSVERIEEYYHKPVEAPVETDYHVSESWPEHGKVEFKHFSARYREGLDLCIRDANFTVEPQEKVGIVGRTGAGKSSLTLALFRIIEAADSFWALASDPSQIDHTIDSDAFAVSGVNGSGGGSIEIDGVDISRLGLRDLRSRLAIIPQEPTLFSGTIRENLDPFKKYDDSMLWGALERAHLKDYIIGLEGGLAYEVAQDGENFSVGQRSLLCLARALLRKSTVLILDEATAAVDVETDNLIQKTIHKEFKDRTILTIAHRIKTVKASDKILVLEQARVREFETPSALLERRDSLFYMLAQHAGEI